MGLGKNRFSSLAPDSALDSRFAGPARNTEPGLDFADQEVAGGGLRSHILGEE